MRKAQVHFMKISKTEELRKTNRIQDIIARALFRKKSMKITNNNHEKKNLAKKCKLNRIRENYENEC